MEFGENIQVPNAYYAITQETELNCFTFTSDFNFCSLLKTWSHQNPTVVFWSLALDSVLIGFLKVCVCYLL